MSILYGDQNAEDILPRGRCHHRRIGEHATVPADMLISTGGNTFFITHPEACNLDDVHLSIWIRRKAVTPGLIMRSGSQYCPIILSHMKIDRPWPQGIRYRSEC